MKYFPAPFISEGFLEFASKEIKMDSYDLESFTEDMTTFEYLVEMQQEGLYKIDEVLRSYIRTDIE